MSSDSFALQSLMNLHLTHAVAVGGKVFLILHVGCKVIWVASHKFHCLIPEIHVIHLTSLSHLEETVFSPYALVIVLTGSQICCRDKEPLQASCLGYFLSPNLPLNIDNLRSGSSSGIASKIY